MECPVIRTKFFEAFHDKLLQGLLIKKEVCSNARD